jgi:hypothetical protein
LATSDNPAASTAVPASMAWKLNIRVNMTFLFSSHLNKLFGSRLILFYQSG